MSELKTTNAISKSITDDLFKGVNPTKISDMDFSKGDDVTQSSSGSSMSSFQWILIFLAIIFFLAFIGFNVFTYLSKGTDKVTHFFHPVFDLFSKSFGGTIKEVATTSTTGIETGANISTGVVKGAALGGMKGLQLSQDELDSAASSSSSSSSQETDNNHLHSSLQTSSGNSSGSSGGNGSSGSSGGGGNNKYTPDDSFSSIQTSGKSGFCYYGSDNGIRYCSEIGAGDKCVSGQIFPTREICINPNLRE
jgi:hypothetical protein